MSLMSYFWKEARRQNPNWDGKLLVSKVIQSISGKTIIPPSHEVALYKPTKLIIKNVSWDAAGWKFVVNEELHKFEKDALGFQAETIILKSSFRVSSDLDSIYQKWSVEEASVAGLSKEQIGRLNGTRSATHCCVCGAKLIPLWGMILWCPTCEKD